MVLPPDERLKIFFARAGMGAEQAGIIASQSWIGAADQIKRTERTIVLAGEIDHRPVIVKAMRLRSWRDLPSRLVGRTRLGRQLAGALLLRRAGIPTAEPLLFVRGRVAGRRGVHEALVLERLGGRSLLHTIASGEPDVAREHALARAVGALTGQLHARDLRNRDHKPSNLIVGGETPIGLAIIDTVGVGRGAYRPGPARMLANLVWELLGTGHLPRRALLMRAVTELSRALERIGASETASARSLWRDASALVLSHGDCTPRDDPLVQ